MATGYASDSQERACWTAAWGLRNCRGFQVDTPLARLGYVEEVLLDDDGEPRALVVTGERRIVVPIGEVVAVDVDFEHVRLR